MKLPLIFTLVFALLAGSYTTPVEDTKTTIPPAVVKADAIAANDAAQAETNPEIAPEEHKVNAIDATDEVTAPKAEPDVIVDAINASDAVPKAPKSSQAEAIDASDDFTAPKAEPDVVVNAINASDAVPKAPKSSQAETIDASDDFTAPVAEPEVVVNAIAAGTPEDGKITADEAKEIALSHAGLACKKVRDLEAEPDRERGKSIYEVSFESGNYDYEYEIDAKTGEILIADKEWDD